METNPTEVILYRSVHNIWLGIIHRCDDLTNENYGKRGIAICAEWRASFAAFMLYVGPRPGPEYSIDRIRVDGNYEPGNIRWATPKTQANNRRPRKLSINKSQNHLGEQCQKIEQEQARLRALLGL